MVMSVGGTDRRAWLLGAGASAIAGAAAPLPSFAARGTSAASSGPIGNLDLWSRPRELWVTRPQAQEQVKVVYWADGQILGDGYRRLNRIFRDLLAGVERPIAVELLDLNYIMQVAVATLLSPRPLVLLSGFRTAATNAKVGGVEPNIHGAGQADDSIYERMSLEDNYRLARYFQVGGLGYYPDRKSIHKDVGPRRNWVEYGPARPQLS
jgi:uncharacterized protein YcbK (DUF882 family)